MKLPKNLANLLLAVYLILVGLEAFNIAIPYANLVMGVCAIGAGILLLLGRR
jgi:hypothetical protein